MPVLDRARRTKTLLSEMRLMGSVSGCGDPGLCSSMLGKAGGWESILMNADEGDGEAETRDRNGILKIHGRNRGGLGD